MNNRPKACVDFETRSACSLRKTGTWRYSQHPTTEILCLAWRMPYWPDDQIALWHPAFPHLDILEEGAEQLPELFEWILAGELIEAHNSLFERAIWTNLCVPKLGWPPIKNEQYRCSAAKAAVHALPRALEDAIPAMHLTVEKDIEGQAVMKKITKPRKAVKLEVEQWANKHNAGKCVVCKGKGTYKRKPCGPCGGQGVFPTPLILVPEMPLLWHESRILFERLWTYCQQDVAAEASLSDALPDLSPEETEIYLLDQLVNERGFMLDREAITTALKLIAAETECLNAELDTLTDGQVKKATQRAQMIKWFGEQGLTLLNTQKATLKELLDQDDQLVFDKDPVPWLYPLPPLVRRGLEIVLALGKSSTAKYDRMRDWICPDDRVRGGLLYHGASTGRWTGSGVQPHNFPKGKIDDIEEVWDALKTEDESEIEDAYDDVMTTLSHALRGVIVPSPGKTLYVADYASIEARGLLWLAEDEDGLDIFRQNRDPYCEMASEIFGRPITKADTFERALGKVGILGLGYQMGWTKFIESAKLMGGIDIDEEMSRRTVDAYRTKFWRVKQMWEDQEAAAIAAVESGEPQSSGKIWWFTEDRFLYCILPSGRRLAYPYPEVHERETPWGAMKPSLTHKGVNTHNRQWQRLTVYGGLLVENQVQAMCRDLLAAAMLRCEQSKVYQPILSVHDEILAESYAHLGNVHEFEDLMAQCPDWATGFPVRAEGWCGLRYRK